MTIDKSNLEQNLALPEIESPRALDDKILNYARSNAPQRPRFIKPAWMSGLAAASIVGIAVMITLPEEHSPTHMPQPQLITEPVPGTSDSIEESRVFVASPKASPRMEIYGDAETEPGNQGVAAAEVATHPAKSMPAPKVNAKAKARQDTQLDTHAVEIHSTVAADTPAAPAAAQAQANSHTDAWQGRDAALTERIKNATEPKGGNSRALEEAVVTASKDETDRWHSGNSSSLEELVVTSGKREDQGSLALEEVAITAIKKDTPQSTSAPAPAEAEAAAAPSDILLEQQQRQQLQSTLGQRFETLEECLRLWRKAHQAEATECYSPLLEDCENCGLPQTVGEAAEAFHFIGTSEPRRTE